MFGLFKKVIGWKRRNEPAEDISEDIPQSPVIKRHFIKVQREGYLESFLSGFDLTLDTSVINKNLDTLLSDAYRRFDSEDIKYLQKRLTDKAFVIRSAYTNGEFNEIAGRLERVGSLIRKKSAPERITDYNSCTEHRTAEEMVYSH